MAQTIATIQRSAAGGLGGDPRTVWVDVNITSYVTGGEVVLTGLRTVLFATCEQKAGRLVQYDRATDRLLVFQDNSTATAAALPQVPAATNVGTVRLRLDGLE